MKSIASFTVEHRYPAPLERLGELSTNLYWTWCPTIREFFRSISPSRWQATNHDPLAVLASLSRDELAGLAGDAEFLKRYEKALATLDAYRGGPTWFQGEKVEGDTLIAYFSAEFGLHESVPLYSGGLGVLSGDHTKSASDLGLPFVGVGLLYQFGYFKQRIALEGGQTENYDRNDPAMLPVRRLCDAKENPVVISVPFPEGDVYIGAWEMQVGRARLVLLDTNLPENADPACRDITGYLYGGDRETRIRQEIVLGIGGMRMLTALGIEPTVTHCNEGHSAFLLLERARIAMRRLHLSFPEARELVASGSVFTTHTPVPAGHDVFDAEMMSRYFAGYARELGLSFDEFMGLGRVNPADASEGFSMTVLALRCTSRRNGVSQLHGEVSRKMWGEVWPEFPDEESPIIGITNGVHTLSFASDRMEPIFSQHISPGWRDRVNDPAMWSRAKAIPDAEIWEAKNAMRREMIEYLRLRLLEGHAETYTRGAKGRDLTEILDPDALTIGFARRFASYKRATLIFRDPDRAWRLFTDSSRPLQLIIAGKAHPKDEPGKQLIRDIFAFVRQSGLEHRIVFIENYDLGIARAMTQGCDVWLNTPRRPLEASGTSGMKALINGTVNVSILDGWYPEGYDGRNGFAIGDESGTTEHAWQDEIESRHLYRLLEEDVVPTFYRRDANGVPTDWTAIQKHALATMTAQFASDRMVEDYTRLFYLPLSSRFLRMSSDGAAEARRIGEWRKGVGARWSGVKVTAVETDPAYRRYALGEPLRVRAKVDVSGFAPQDLAVEAVTGPVAGDGTIALDSVAPLAFAGADNGVAVFEGEVPFNTVGRNGVTVRVRPNAPDGVASADLGLIRWAETGV